MKRGDVVLTIITVAVLCVACYSLGKASAYNDMSRQAIAEGKALLGSARLKLKELRQ